MSHVETIMFVVLGLAVALLIILFFGRGYLAIASKLRKRRIARGTPTTIAELRAENDRLKAESAIASHRLEQRAKDLKSKLAEQTAEVSRNRNRIELMAQQLEQRSEELEQTKQQLSETQISIEPLELELAKRAQNSQKLREEAHNSEAVLSDLRRERNQLEMALLARDQEVDQLKTDLAGTDKVATTMAADVADAQKRLQERIAELTTMSQQIEEQHHELAKKQENFAADIAAAQLQDESGDGIAQMITAKLEAAPDAADAPEDAGLQDKFDRARRETGELQNELQKLDELWHQRLSELEAIRNSAATTTAMPAAAPETEDPAPEPKDNSTKPPDPEEAAVPEPEEAAVPEPEEPVAPAPEEAVAPAPEKPAVSVTPEAETVPANGTKLSLEQGHTAPLPAKPALEKIVPQKEPEARRVSEPAQEDEMAVNVVSLAERIRSLQSERN